MISMLSLGVSHEWWNVMGLPQPWVPLIWLFVYFASAVAIAFTVFSEILTALALRVWLTVVSFTNSHL
jgi:hypothetical protein